jgi:uncharacterized protein (TIGR00297 family)
MAVGLSLGIAASGWAARALTGPGAAVAVLVGSAVLWRIGWAGMAALGAFFIGASLISRLAPDQAVAALDAKGQQRDPWQVLANGGAAAAGALFAAGNAEAGLWIVTASLAAAAADTWATATGGWSRTDPRHILTGRRVPAGTSGGVTWAGTAGALLGAALVSGSAAVVAARPLLFPLALGVGMLGMIADSALGAAWQGRFHCPVCDRATERRMHGCGRRTTLRGGWSWLSNDAVNAVATTLSAVAGWLAWRWVA